jgi:molybdate transport system substrate-binding protein
MRRISHGFVVSVTMACAALTGCEKRGAERPATDSRSLLVFCGAGLRPPMAELAEQFEQETGIDVEVDYAGHQVLLSKIKLGRQGDMYVPGDKRYVDLAAEEGLILSRESVCYFVPTILVQKGNPKRISGLHDLVRPGVRLGLGNSEACAIGRKSKRIFEKNNVPWPDVERNLLFQSATVNELGMHIQAQSLDAVIVWDAVAAYYARHGDEVPIPVRQNVISTVEAGILKYTSREALARRFLEFMISDPGQQVFRKHGYRVTPPRSDEVSG